MVDEALKQIAALFVQAFGFDLLIAATIAVGIVLVRRGNAMRKLRP